LKHFKKLQENLEFHQNKCHPRDVPDTRRQCAKATDQWARGVAGRPGFMSVWPTSSCTCVYTRRGSQVVEKVGGGQTTWSVGHVARPACHHLVSYRLNQVGNPSLNPDKYPSTGGDATCKALILSVVARRSLIRRVARL
jgi:hypothetical protein